MSNDAPKAPQGWYPGPDGELRYWDGENWLDIPAPSAEGAPSISAQGTPHAPKPRKRLGWIIAAVTAVVLLSGAGVAYAIVDHNWRVEAAENKAAAEAQREADNREREAQRQKAAEEREERKLRETLISDVEESVTKMAKDHIKDDFLEGEVLSVDCVPVAGGSMEDLTQKTAVLECFVALEDNGDGTSSGQYYNATVSWETGRYTYGFGQP